MILEPGLSGSSGVRLASLQFESSFVYLKVHEELGLVCLTLHVGRVLRSVILILNRNPRILSF